jgi:hypothetical protein
LYPLARKTDLTIETLPSETVVYDTSSHRVHCLNDMARSIWSHCDGKSDEEQIAQRLSDDLKTPVQVDVVKLGLSQLSRRGLLVQSPDTAEIPRMTRRDVSRRLAIAGGALATIMPAITSMVAPTPAMAKSGDSGKPKDKPDAKPKPRINVSPVRPH